jgi:hypothetical protein
LFTSFRFDWCHRATFVVFDERIILFEGPIR